MVLTSKHPLAAALLSLALSACGQTLEHVPTEAPQANGEITSEPKKDATATPTPTPDPTTAPTSGATPTPVPMSPSSSTVPALPDGEIKRVPVSCFGSSNVTTGSGTITRTTRPATGFVRVEADFSGDVFVQEGSAFRVQIETDSNLQDLVTASVNGDTLVLSTGEGSVCFNELRVLVTLPAAQGFTLAGSGNATITKMSRDRDFALVLSGSGEVTLAGGAAKLTIDLSGSGSIHLVDGSASATTVDVSGSGDVDARGFSPGAVQRNLTGTGEISL